VVALVPPVVHVMPLHQTQLYLPTVTLNASLFSFGSPGCEGDLATGRGGPACRAV
jgi:hypothetical protein